MTNKVQVNTTASSRPDREETIAVNCLEVLEESGKIALKPTRVLLLAPQPFFIARGTPINVRAMAETLGQAGYVVDLLAFPFGCEPELVGVSVHRSAGIWGITEVPIGPSWQKFFLDIPFAFKALQLARKNNYAVLHGVEEGGLVAGIISYLLNVPYILDMDSCMPEQLKLKGYVRNKFLLALVSRIEKAFAVNADAVLTVCQSLTDKVNSLGKIDQVHQIEDFPIDQPAEVLRYLPERFRKQFGLRAQDKVVLYTGNFMNYQGVELLIAGFAEAVKGNSSDVADWKLLLVGGGALDGQDVARCRALTTKLAVESQVIFTGDRPSDEMGAFMALADVLASPRMKGENTPLKLYCYMQAGKPIVATNIVSHTQVLTEGESFLCDPNAVALAVALRAAVSSSGDESQAGNAPLSAKARAAAAKKLVETRYSKAEFQRKLLKLYQELIAEKV